MKAKAWSDVYKKYRQTLAPRLSRLAATLSAKAKPLYTLARSLLAKSTHALAQISAQIRPHLCFARSKKALRAYFQAGQKRLQAYWHTLRKNPAQSVAGVLMGASVSFGLFSVFVAGGLYERHESATRQPAYSQPATHTATPASTPAAPESSSPESHAKSPPSTNLTTSGTRQVLQTAAPTMPKPDERESIIAGSLTYGNAIAIARQNLLERDFTRARIWIYRAYLIAPNVQEVWDLYWQSWDSDAHASIKQKQEAYALTLYARSYYRF